MPPAQSAPLNWELPVAPATIGLVAFQTGAPLNHMHVCELRMTLTSGRTFPRVPGAVNVSTLLVIRAHAVNDQ